jgi:hypothetical protein
LRQEAPTGAEDLNTIITLVDNVDITRRGFRGSRVVHGGPKARGFEQILGITIDAIDYIEVQILACVLDTPISEIRDNAPYGVNCVVVMPVRGIGAKADRVVNVRTVWAFDRPGTPPRAFE